MLHGIQFYPQASARNQMRKLGLEYLYDLHIYLGLRMLLWCPKGTEKGG